MKKLLVLSVIVLSGILIFSACGKKEGILGTWEIVSATGAMSEMNMGMTYDFSSNGTVVMKKGFSNEATFSLTGEELAITVGGVTIKSTVKIAGDKMTMTIQNSDQVFELNRK